MADISKIDFGDGVERDIKDATARAIATTQSVGRVKPDGTTITIDENGTISSVGGGGNTIAKKHYKVNASNWSASQDSYGYYQNDISLSPYLNSSFPPNVYIAGTTASDAQFAEPTDTQKSMFNLLDWVELTSIFGTAAHNLRLRAKTKPTSDFYIYVEGVNA